MSKQRHGYGYSHEYVKTQWISVKPSSQSSFKNLRPSAREPFTSAVCVIAACDRTIIFSHKPAGSTGVKYDYHNALVVHLRKMGVKYEL